MQTFGQGAYATLLPETGIPPSDNRIEVDLGNVPFMQSGTYLLDVHLERVQGNQSYNQGFRLIIK